MAKIFSAPAEIKTPDLSDYKNWQENDTKYLTELREWCRKNGSGALCGEIVREPVADGYAQYMVYTEKPLQLIHVPTGDAWQFRWASKWNLTDIRNMVKRQKALAELFKQKS